jgi:hypothetical protein
MKDSSIHDPFALNRECDSTEFIFLSLAEEGHRMRMRNPLRELY